MEGTDDTCVSVCTMQRVTLKAKIRKARRRAMSQLDMECSSESEFSTYAMELV